MNRVSNCEITGTKWQNAPYYHFDLEDIDNFEIHHMEIFVDVWKQQNLMELYGMWDYSINYPTFPLNTDGIDPSGSNVYIHHVKITNFDDAVAVKPASKSNQIAQCAETIVVEDSTVVFGVGMTIGSVPPSSNHACIRDVTFRNIDFHYPIKAVYVKTNPGSGSGEIQNITYENLTINFPIWWNIYIGPQQQKQPGGAGPGCMFYPLGGCETQPLIDMDNVVLRNITSTGGLLPPGIIRCNETNPCTGFEFTDVQVDGWWNSGIFRFFHIGYISQHAYGTQSNSHPSPKLLADDGSIAPMMGEEIADPFDIDLFGFLVEAFDYFKNWMVEFKPYHQHGNEHHDHKHHHHRSHGKHHHSREHPHRHGEWVESMLHF